MNALYRTLGLLGLATLCGAAALAAAPGQDQLAAGQEAAKVATDDAAVVREQLPAYPLDTCVISGEPLGSMGEPIDMVADGQLVRLCCKGCKKGVEKDPAAAKEKVRAAVVAAQKPIYPLDSCVVSGEPLGSMGEPIEHVVGTRLVRLCCKGCVKGVDKAPEKAIAKIDAALIPELAASYPLETCVVSGEPLGSMGEPVDKLYGVTLVRLCCKGCTKEFERDPGALAAKVRAAAKAKPAAEKK